MATSFPVGLTVQESLLPKPGLWELTASLSVDTKFILGCSARSEFPFSGEVRHSSSFVLHHQCVGVNLFVRSKQCTKRGAVKERVLPAALRSVCLFYSIPPSFWIANQIDPFRWKYLCNISNDFTLN